MTPTEEKAIAKAEELFGFFSAFITNDLRTLICCFKICDENIQTLNSMKGLGKIHKVKFWKLVKQTLKDEYKA